MKCPSCGAPVGGKAVCPRCGARQPDPTDRVIGRIVKKCTMTNLLLVILCLAALVTAGALLGEWLAPAAPFGYRTGDGVTFWQGEDTALAVRGGEIISRGSEAPRVLYAGDLSLAAYISSGMLTLADNGGVTVTSLAATEVIAVSDDGAAVFCRDDAGRTVQYLTATKYTHVVSENEAVETLIPSPDGRCAVYSTVAGDGDDAVRKLYFFDGRTSVCFAYFGGNALPVSTDNKGRCIYAISDGVLYRCTKNGGDRETVGAVGGTVVRTSRDATEILFTGADGLLYLAAPGKVTVSLGATAAAPVAPVGCACATFRTGGVTVIRHDCARLANLLFRTEAAVCRLSDAGLLPWLPMGADGTVVWSADEQYIFSLDDGVLTRRAAGGTGEETVIAEDAALFAVSRDGKTVYYTDSETKLYTKVGSGKPYFLADDVSRLFVAGDGTFWFLVDDVLYASANPRSKKPVLSGTADVAVTDGAVYAAAAEGLYAGTGASLRLLASGVFVRLGT